MAMIRMTMVALVALQLITSGNGFNCRRPPLRVMALGTKKAMPLTILRSDSVATQPHNDMAAASVSKSQASRIRPKSFNGKISTSKILLACSTAGIVLTMASMLGLGRGPFAFTFIPYIACLLWGMPSTMIGNWKSLVPVIHRFGGMATLVMPLILSRYHAITGLFPSKILYLATVIAAGANLGFGASLIFRSVPGYDIPTLRAFTVGVSLGFSFLGQSLLFIFGPSQWYRPIAATFSTISIYSVIFAWSDALQHAWNYIRGKRGISSEELFGSNKENEGGGSYGRRRRRFWTLPFEKSQPQDVFLRNLWRQPTEEALSTTVSPANGVVVFTTGMTALFASLSLIQLRYLAIGPVGMSALLAAESNFCYWSALQALLAVVANNFGTFVGTLVIQRKTSQKMAGIFNAIGLLIPVLNIAAFLALNNSTKSPTEIFRLMLLPSIK